MNIRKQAVFAVALALFGSFSFAQKLQDKGTFQITQNGAPFGQEEFSIDLEGGAGVVSTLATFNVPKEERSVAVSIETRLEYAGNLTARSYRLTIQEAREKQGIGVLFGAEKAACTFDLGTRQEHQDVVFPANGAILDHNVFAHVAVLLLRFDEKRMGNQGFTVFVPQLGKDGIGTVFIRYVGKDECRYSRRKAKADHFIVNSPNLTMDVWRDSSGRTLKIDIPRTGAVIERAR